MMFLGIPQTFGGLFYIIEFNSFSTNLFMDKEGSKLHMIATIAAMYTRTEGNASMNCVK